MPYPAYQGTVQCPQCGQENSMVIEQIIDVGENPVQQERLLSGQINVLNCQRCGVSGPISIPMVYHDASQELLISFMPNQMQMRLEEEEREIGRLTNMILQKTPAKQRKGYLLNPVRVITYEGLIEKIMEAEGVTAEDLRKQSKKIQIIMQMAQAAYEDEKLIALIHEHKEDIDYNFMLLVTTTIQQGAEMHDEPTVDRYGRLRETIVKELDLKADQVPSLGAEANIDDLINAMLATPASMLQSAVAANRPLIDYNFFMHLTERMDKASDEREKEKLLSLRKTLVKLTEKMDKEAQEAMQRAAYQLEQVLKTDDIDGKLNELHDELDEGFLVVLSANIEQAKTYKRDDIVELLTYIYRRVVEMMESRLRPELRAMNDLLRMKTSQERRARLEKEMQIYNPAGFIQMIEAIAGDLEESGQAQSEVLQGLYMIADEAREVAAMKGAFTPPVQSLFGTDQAPPKTSGLILTPQEERRQREGQMPGIILP